MEKLTALKVASRARELRKLSLGLDQSEEELKQCRDELAKCWKALQLACPHPLEHRSKETSSIEDFEVCNLCGWSDL